MRVSLAVVVLGFGLGCSGLLGQVRERQIAEMAVQLRAVPEGPERDEVAGLLDAAWLARDALGSLEISGFSVELDGALRDGAISAVELGSLRVKGERFVAPPGLTEAQITAQMADKHRMEVAVAAEVEREATTAAPRTPSKPAGRTGVFAKWQLPEGLSERGTALGWEIADCAVDEESGRRWGECRFIKGDQHAVIEIQDEGDTEWARDLAAEDRKDGIAVARDGRTRLTVEVYDAARATALGIEIAPDDVDLAALGGRGFEQRLAAAGWSVADCMRRLDEDGASDTCVIKRTGWHGEFDWESAKGEPPAKLTREEDDGEVVIDQGNAAITLAVVDEAGSAALLDGMLAMPATGTSR